MALLHEDACKGALPDAFLADEHQLAHAPVGGSTGDRVEVLPQLGPLRMPEHCRHRRKRVASQQHALD